VSSATLRARPAPATGPFTASAGAAAGLVVNDLQEQALRVVFYDVAAVVHFLRKVLWTVPGFTVDGYTGQLARMHERILARGPFVSHAQRFLIEARKPRRPGPPRTGEDPAARE
jgi:hypothetical protein